MSSSDRETWAALHGIVFGGLLLLGFSAAVAGIWSLRHEYLTGAGVTARVGRLVNGLWTMAGLAWISVITGTWASQGVIILVLTVASILLIWRKDRLA